MGSFWAVHTTDCDVVKRHSRPMASVTMTASSHPSPTKYRTVMTLHVDLFKGALQVGKTTTIALDPILRSKLYPCVIRVYHGPPQRRPCMGVQITLVYVHMPAPVTVASGSAPGV